MKNQELIQELRDWYSTDAPRKAADLIEKLEKELDTADKAYKWMDETYKGKLAEIDELKKTINEARNVIQNIVWGDRKPFNEDGWALVPWIAIAKGADFLGKTEE